MKKKGFSLAETLISMAIFSFLLTIIVQFIILYNQMKRNIEKISDISFQAKNISKKIDNLLHQTINENNKISFSISNSDIVIKRISLPNNQTISAIGIYTSHRNEKYWQLEIFNNNITNKQNVLNQVYPIYYIKNQDNLQIVILHIYADIYSSILFHRKSKPKKVCFSTFLIKSF